MIFESLSAKGGVIRSPFVRESAYRCQPTSGCVEVPSQTRLFTKGAERYLAEKTLKQAAPKRAIDSTAFLVPSAGLESGSRPIYLDYQATTPMDPRVLDAMIPAYTEKFGNAHSRTHAYGWEAESMTEDARAHVADLIGAQPREIIFTSGATESNNLAIKGIADFYGKSRGKKHMITLQTEHKCVLASAQHLEFTAGWDVTYLPVGKDGLVDPKSVSCTYLATVVNYCVKNHSSHGLIPLSAAGSRHTSRYRTCICHDGK